MSLNGLKTFSDNIKSLQATDKWKNASEKEKGELAIRLMHSRFGLGIFGKVYKIPVHNPTTTEGN